MRKTRLVILPTKCLHQMGFLLLFLSCPVIGDWGRIRPDNENLQRAIEVDREGTCGLQRDTPGGFRDLADGKGLNVRRFREDTDSNLPRTIRTDEERRITRNRFDERRRERTAEFRRQRDSQERSIRSRSAEPRREDRNDARRSLSLSRLEASRRQTRRESDSERRDGERRLSLSRRMNERENERRIEREGERTQNERIRSSPRLSLQRREDEMRRQDRNAREKTERRLSLSRMEENSRRNQRSDASERRLPEMRKSGERTERDAVATIRREVERRQKSGENARDERRMEILNRRVEKLEKTRRLASGVSLYPEDKTESFFAGAMKWLSPETPKIGDWSSNCVIGAVAYYLTTRTTKTV